MKFEEVTLGEMDGDLLVPGRIAVNGVAGTGMAALVPEHSLLSFCFDLGLSIAPVTHIERKESGFCADHRITPKFRFGSMTLDAFDDLSQKPERPGAAELAGITYLGGQASKENKGPMTQSILSFGTSNLFEEDGLHVSFKGTLGGFHKGNLGLWHQELPVGHTFEITAFVAKPVMLVVGLNVGWMPWTKLRDRRQLS